MQTKILTILCLGILLTGCQEPNSNEKEARKQELLKQQADNVVGIPAIINYSEKKMMKQIIELRDKTPRTYTYIVDMNGKYHKLCDSMGYGLPYAAQYTNPQAVSYRSSGNSAVLPQADPNGLYSPTSADGTWVMCLNPENQEIHVTYVEPRVIVTTFPLKN